jgi:hypothetical protein
VRLGKDLNTGRTIESSAGPGVGGALADEFECSDTRSVAAGAAPPYCCADRGRRPDRPSTACSIPVTSPLDVLHVQPPRGNLTVTDLEQRHPAHRKGLPVAAGARPAPFAPGRITVLDRPADFGVEAGDPREHGLPVGEHLGPPGEGPARVHRSEGRELGGESAAGISQTVGDSGAELQRAQDKIANMQARAGAVDELLASGVLEDVGGDTDDIQQELDEAGTAAQVDKELVDKELAALKAEIGPGGSPVPPELTGSAGS